MHGKIDVLQRKDGTEEENANTGLSLHQCTMFIRLYDIADSLLFSKRLRLVTLVFALFLLAMVIGFEKFIGS